MKNFINLNILASSSSSSITFKCNITNFLKNVCCVENSSD